MNNTLKYISLAMLSVLSLTACEDDNAIIAPSPGNPGTTDLGEASSKAALSSEYCPNSDIVLFNIGDPENDDRDPNDISRKDRIKLTLTSPLNHDITFRVGMDEDYINNATLPNGSSYCGVVTMQFQKDHNIHVQYKPEILLVEGGSEAIITIKAGETESDFINLEYLRNDFMPFDYLFPIKATDISTGEVFAEINYVVRAKEDLSTPDGQKSFVFVGHIDTEVMSPLAAIQFSLKIEKRIGRRNRQTIYNGSWFDIINLRTATIKPDNNGNVILFLNPDITHVLKNRNKYIAPLQQIGQKVCLAIKGGNAGLGFSNMTDQQITDLTDQIKVAVELYGLDGVNLYDIDAGYNKDGAPSVNPESYAKLIKSLKTAMPDKLLTLVDTRETTEALCVPVAGISIGDYLDYAWSTVNDFIAPYEAGLSYKALAGMPENKYGTVNMADMSTWAEEDIFEFEENSIFAELFFEERFSPFSATNVLVYDNIPYYDYNNEGFYWDFSIMYYQLIAMPGPEDGSYSYNWNLDKSKSMWSYNGYRKDW